jgi:all-trans-8'-apo-beta-carotenal 15,15'-oxygenase
LAVSFWWVPPVLLPDVMKIRGPSQSERDHLLAKFAKGWQSQPAEEAKGFYFTPDQIEGAVPLQLKGTFFRNGPGLTEVFGTPLNHPIDGDGLVCSITFCEGKVHFRSKFVATKTHVEESKAGAMMYDGQMGSKAPKATKKKGWRDPAHTNVFYHAGRLLALHEYTLPHSLDPTTLNTLGRDDLGGALELKAMSAHYRYDADKDIMVTCGFRVGVFGTKPQLSVYEWDRTMKLLQATRVSVPGLHYAHDFLMTPNWYLFHITPFIDVTEETLKKIALGQLAPGQTMRYIPGARSGFCLIERYPKEAGSPQIVCIDADPCHIYHFANCREESGVITFQACCLPPTFNMDWVDQSFLSNAGEAPGVMNTFQINTSNMGMSRMETRGLSTTACEFPTSNPFRHCVRDGASTRYVYLMAGAPCVAVPFCDVVKHDSVTNLITRWHSEGVVGEPCFVPRLGRASAWHGEEDDGWIIVQLYLHQQHKVQFVILDAQQIHKGPICRIHLPFHLPYGFHGTFSEEVFTRTVAKL